MKKQLLLVALVMVMLCALLPQIIMPASAGDVILPPDTFDNIVSGTCGSGVRWELNKDTGVLKITGTGKMNDWYNLLDSKSPWYSYRASIKTVEIGNGVTSIGERAFYNCSSLTSVTIPDSVTSIGSYAFEECSSLTSVTIPDSVTSIGDGAFDGCSSLTSVTIPDSVTSIGFWAFSGCSSLTAVYISDMEAWCNIEFSGNYSNPLYHAHNLYLNEEIVTDLIIPDGVTSIGESAFYGCSSLTSVTIPDSVTSIGDYAFRNCSSLTSVTIPEGVTSIGDSAFYDCAELTSVTIPDSVTSIGGRAFYGCSRLTSVTIGNSVTSIGDYAFRNCSSLTSVTIPDSVTSIGGRAFYGCSRLTSITIPDSVTSIGDYAFDDCSSLTSVTIGNSVTSIGDYAFCLCSSLTSVTIPDSVTSIGRYAFIYCSSLKKVFYAGTENEWNKISIESDNEPLAKAKIHYGVTDPASHCFLISTTAPTCSSKGSSTFSCACGYTWSEEIPMLSHTWAYTKTVTPTCGADGYDIETCSKCGQTQKTNIITERPDHTYADEIFAATCTTAGYIKHTCTACGNTYNSDFVSPLGHVWQSVAEIPATCAEAGHTAGVCCTRCGEYQSGGAVIPALEHRNTSSEHKDATCTESGYDRTVCKDCSKVISEKTIPALGHAWDAGTVTTQPTCMAKGVKTYTCTRCSSTKTEEVAALGHNYNAVATAPTCTQQGYTTHICSRCNDSYIDSYTNALGHNFVNGVCTRCGEKDPNYVPPVKPDIEFTDVTSADWYYKAVNFAVSNGLFNGMTATTFEPNTAMNRAMLVTVLWRYEGSPKEGTNTFADVKAGQWYTDAVAWASSNGIVGGVGSGKFDPNGNVTREQLAAILFRYCDYQGIGNDARGELFSFPDKSKVSPWATNAYSWAVGEGLIGGNKIGGQTLLDPQGNATRAQVATILMRFIQNIA